MQKYDLSQIMRSAWDLYHMSQKWINKMDFADCLRRAWRDAKEAVKVAAEVVKIGLRRMHYSEYKSTYSDCETVNGSYDKATKTIEVMTLVRKGFKRIAYNGLCPHCHTYCYGDCMAH